MQEMTNREKEVYHYICDYISKNHYAPSIRDISKSLYISLTVVKKHLDNLVCKGYLYYTPKIARSYFPKECVK